MYLCHLLMNRTIVLQSVTKNLSDDDESDGKIVEIMNMIWKRLWILDWLVAAETGDAIEYPSQWLEYSCTTQQIDIGIEWDSNTDVFDLALLRIDLKSPASQWLWQVQSDEIQNFLSRATPDEVKRLQESLALISVDAVFRRWVIVFHLFWKHHFNKRYIDESQAI